MPTHAGRLLLTTALALGLAGAAQAAPRQIPPDQSRTVQGVQVACAGVGNSSQDNPRWDAYPIKLSFVGDHGQYLGDERVLVRDHTGRTLQVECHAPWVLMGLRPGHYSATAMIPDGSTKHIDFTVPERGQRRIMLRYETQTGDTVEPTNTGYRPQGESGEGTHVYQWQNNDHNQDNRSGYSRAPYRPDQNVPDNDNAPQ